MSNATYRDVPHARVGWLGATAHDRIRLEAELLLLARFADASRQDPRDPLGGGAGMGAPMAIEWRA